VDSMSRSGRERSKLVVLGECLVNIRADSN
jgi:hypothetical protein